MLKTQTKMPTILAHEAHCTHIGRRGYCAKLRVDHANSGFGIDVHLGVAIEQLQSCLAHRTTRRGRDLRSQVSREPIVKRPRGDPSSRAARLALAISRMARSA